MEELSPFHRALVVRRDRYNARFRAARSLNAGAFLAHLRDFVGPVVDACAADPVPVADALVELSVSLAGWRPHPEFWPLLRSVARFVGAQPRRVPAALVNALHHLDNAPTGRPAEWIGAVLALAPAARDCDELLDAAAVAAWRCGLARLRASALKTASRLRPEVLAVAVGWSDVDLGRLAADPWFAPSSSGGSLRVVCRAGSFRGFGGPFARPPVVSTSGDAWYASDGEGAWRVYADRFGVGFRRVERIPGGQEGGGLVLAGGQVIDEATGEVLDVPELAEASSWASRAGTLAATTPWTHGILFVARTTDGH
jgi:hypothetical protein